MRSLAPDLELYTCETVEDAVNQAVMIARQRDLAVFAGGGMFLAIEAQEAFAGRDPAALRFY